MSAKHLTCRSVLLALAATCLAVFLFEGALAVPLETTSNPNALLSRSPLLAIRAGNHKFKLDGEEYTATKLRNQGTKSKTYALDKPFKGHHAILKIVKDTKDAETESEYTKKVGLLLHSEKHNDELYMVIIDVRKDYLVQGMVLKTYIDWCNDDETGEMETPENFAKYKGCVKKTLVQISEKWRLYYYDVHMDNFFVDKELKTCIAIDWAPDEGSQGKAGVIPATDENKVDWEKDIDLLVDTLDDDAMDEGLNVFEDDEDMDVDEEDEDDYEDE